MSEPCLTMIHRETTVFHLEVLAFTMATSCTLQMHPTMNGGRPGKFSNIRTVCRNASVTIFRSDNPCIIITTNI